MREEAFRALLSRRISRESAASYMANARRVERVLAADLDNCDLTEGGIAVLRDLLVARGVPSRKASDCASALRAYAGIGKATEAAPRQVKRQGECLISIRTLDLLTLRGRIDDELRDRSITRTGNGPVGDYAEALFAHAFLWTLEPNSALGHDATDAKGQRYQIKARREGRSPGVRQLGALRRLPECDFDWLAAVIFDPLFRVFRAALIPHALVATLAKRVEHTNSWRLMLSDRVWTMPGVRDVTGKLSAAQATLPDRISAGIGLPKG